MRPKEKAKELVNHYRMILMEEDTECGNEILCTTIAKKCAKVAVDELLKVLITYAGKEYDYYLEVKQEIQKL